MATPEENAKETLINLLTQTTIDMAVFRAALDAVPDINFHHSATGPSTAKNSTPLHFAAYAGHDEALVLLLNRKADIKSRNSLNEQPIHLASRLSKSSTLKLLLDFKEDNRSVDLNASYDGGCTPLHDAVNQQLFDNVELLLKYGADTEVPAKFGRHDNATPLHFAAGTSVSFPQDPILKKNLRKIVQILLDYGANAQACCNHADSGMMTPEGFAKYRQNASLELFIRNYSTALTSKFRVKIDRNVTAQEETRQGLRALESAFKAQTTQMTEQLTLFSQLNQQQQTQIAFFKQQRMSINNPAFPYYYAISVALIAYTWYLYNKAREKEIQEWHIMGPLSFVVVAATIFFAVKPIASFVHKFFEKIIETFNSIITTFDKTGNTVDKLGSLFDEMGNTVIKAGDTVVKVGDGILEVTSSTAEVMEQFELSARVITEETKRTIRTAREVMVKIENSAGNALTKLAGNGETVAKAIERGITEGKFKPDAKVDVKADIAITPTVNASVCVVS